MFSGGHNCGGKLGSGVTKPALGTSLSLLGELAILSGLNAIITCYRHYDFDGNKSLKMIEVQHFLHDKLPEIHKMNWEVPARWPPGALLIPPLPLSPFPCACRAASPNSPISLWDHLFLLCPQPGASTDLKPILTLALEHRVEPSLTPGKPYLIPALPLQPLISRWPTRFTESIHQNVPTNQDTGQN